MTGFAVGAVLGLVVGFVLGCLSASVHRGLRRERDV